MTLARRSFLKSAGASAVMAGAPAFLRAQSSRPHVLYILTDEWRAQATGYSGDPNAQTPALDKLAGESVNFVNACSNHPVCSPYRSSLITGQFPLTHGIFVNDEELKPKGTTLGQAFADAGYHTGWIGKWHMYGSPQGKYERRTAYIPPDHRFGFHYWKANECTHDYNHSIYYEDDNPAPHYWPGYDAIAETADACTFIEQQAKTRDPFMLVLSMGPPHFPLNTAPERYQALYRDREIQLRPNVPASVQRKAVSDLRGYYSHIKAVDDCIAQLMSTLDKTGIADNTIVVFTADHGDMMGSQGLPSTTKHVAWDESIRIPFLLRYPKKFGTKGRKVQPVLGTPDIMPTLLNLAGLKTPAGVQGTDWSKVAAGAHAPKDSVALLQFPAAYGALRNAGWSEYRGVRTQQYTLVRTLKGPELLFDNQADPYQMNNLVHRSDQKKLLARLDQTLNAHLKAVNDDFLPGAEYIRRWGYEHNREIGPLPAARRG
ncbi:MAG TPA: sulfatase [Bryobacteraceae bacterium]|nr:sulfatase [Bryobacteraceae bacterium]